jgi:hypothetical protein
MSYLIDNAPVNPCRDLNTKDNPIFIGTTQQKGETFNCYGVWVTLPKAPYYRTITNGIRRKETQYWERNGWEHLKDLSQKDAEAWLTTEMERILNGFWFFNNGEAVYLTGQHYYYLNYVQLDVGYPEFRYRDLYFFYFWEAAKNHPHCYGVTMTKPRRMGASWIGVGILLRDITTTRNVLGGILSKTEVDAKNFFRRKLVYAYRNLPYFFRPASASGTNPKMALEFVNMSTKSKEKLNDKNIDDAVLNSYIEYRSTSENSFDSEKLYRLVYDEIGKIEERVDLNDQVDTVLRCMNDNGEVIGKCFAPSTVNKMERGGGQFKELYYNSRFDQAEEERTPTGLWAYFVASYDGLGGYIDKYGRSITKVKKGEVYEDRYGKPITVGSLTKLELDRKLAAKRGNAALIESKRKMPFNEREAFYFSSDDAVLDFGKLQVQIDHNDATTHLSSQRGDFLWVEEFGGKVKWMRNQNGRFLIKWFPPEEKQNQFVIKKGKKAPANSHLIRGGCDPYDIDRVLYGTGSKGGFHLKTTKHFEDWCPILTTVLEYVHRPPTAKMFFEDVLKACMFYGADVLTENQRRNIVYYFEEHGFEHYQIDRPDNTKGKTKSSTKEKGVPMTKDVAALHLDYLHLGIQEEIGELEDGSCGDFPFNETLGQLMRYNIDNRTDLDAVVSWGFANMAVHLSLEKRKKTTLKGTPLIKKYTPQKRMHQYR